ncbi:hypothetical protein KBC79_05420 [Candidatus Woesebacteria bacterium]|nr:hypothetical protein [Candidatus Woesebacteria bacterium]
MDNNNPNLPVTMNVSATGAETGTPKTSQESSTNALLPVIQEKAEATSKAAPQELGPAGGEAANQNAGMSLPPVVTQNVNADDANGAISTPPVVQQPQDDNFANPATAEDVDIVEKEWVDRAKQIVDQNRDDPHRQEQEVEKLQIDYLKKRYGKEIKTSDA